MTHPPVRTWLAMLVLLATIILVPGASGPAAAAGAADAPRVTAEEVKRLAEKGDVVIIDTRTKDSYDFEHAEGALSIPVGELESRLGDLPKDKLIAAYCT